MYLEDMTQVPAWSKKIGESKTLYDGVEVISTETFVDPSRLMHSAFVNALVNLTAMRINVSEADYAMNPHSYSTMKSMINADATAIKYAVALVDGYKSLCTVLNGQDIANMPLTSVLTSMVNSNNPEIASNFVQILRGMYGNPTPGSSPEAAKIDGSSTFSAVLAAMGNKFFASHNVAGKLIRNMIAMNNTVSKLDMLFAMDHSSYEGFLEETLRYVESYALLASNMNQEALTTISPEFPFLLSSYANYRKGQFAHRQDTGESYDGLSFTLSVAALHDGFRKSYLGKAIEKLLVNVPQSLHENDKFKLPFSDIGASAGYVFDASIPIFSFSANDLVQVIEYITNLDLHLSRTKATDYAAFSDVSDYTFGSALPDIPGLTEWFNTMRQLAMYTMLLTPSSQLSMRSQFHPTIQDAMTRLKTTDDITENMREANFYLNAWLAADKYVIEVAKGIFFPMLPKIDANYKRPGVDPKLETSYFYRTNKATRLKIARAAAYLSEIDIVKAEGVLTTEAESSHIIKLDGLVNQLVDIPFRIIKSPISTGDSVEINAMYSVPYNRQIMSHAGLQKYLNNLGNVLEYLDVYKSSPYASAIHQWSSPITINHVKICYHDYSKDIGGDFPLIPVKDIIGMGNISIGSQARGVVFNRCMVFNPFDPSTKLGKPTIKGLATYVTPDKLDEILKIAQSSVHSNWDFTEASYSLIIARDDAQRAVVATNFADANIVNVFDDDNLEQYVYYKFDRISLDYTIFEQMLNNANVGLNLIPSTSIPSELSRIMYSPGIKRLVFRENDVDNPYLLLVYTGYGHLKSMEEIRMYPELNYLFSNFYEALTIPDLKLVSLSFLIQDGLLDRQKFNYIILSNEQVRNNVIWSQFRIKSPNPDLLKYYNKQVNIIETLSKHKPILSMLAKSKNDSSFFIPYVSEIPVTQLNQVVVEEFVEAPSTPIIEPEA